MTQQAMNYNEPREGVRTYTLHLGFLPPSSNVYDKWDPVIQNAVRRKWKVQVRRLCEELGVPKRQPRVGLAATLVFASRGRRDPQNYASFLWKAVPDALQVASVREKRLALQHWMGEWEPVLLDDREGAVSWGSDLGVRFVVDSRKHVPVKLRQRTILTIAVPDVTESGHVGVRIGGVDPLPRGGDRPQVHGE